MALLALFVVIADRSSSVLSAFECGQISSPSTSVFFLATGLFTKQSGCAANRQLFRSEMPTRYIASNNVATQPTEMVRVMPQGWSNVIVVILGICVVDCKYTGAEIRSKQEYPTAEGRCTKVEWRARPAVGNCVITLFSLFNGDLALDSETQHRPAWSEIGIEIFGGSADSNPMRSQLQTQFISKVSPKARKKQHIVYHMVDENANITDIFDHDFHTFGIEFCPSPFRTATTCNTQVTYSLDRNVIRRETGVDVCHLIPPFDIYAAVWVAYPENTWACSPDEKRPFFAETVVEHIKVYENDAVVQKYVFDNENDVTSYWDSSDWGFGYFDGVYDPRNIDFVDRTAVLKLIKEIKDTN